MKIPHDWTFETTEVADGFDRHVREQLPWYDMATGAIAHIARHYIPEGGLVYDIGAATGNIGRAIAPTLESRNARLIAIEPSAAMAANYRGPGEVVVQKAETYPFEPFDLGILFLTMMFVSPSKRRALIGTLRHWCQVGGAIIVFDKCEPAAGYLSTVLYRLTLAGKRSAGVPADEILEKELSLSGVQRPVRVEELGQGLLTEWFRFGDFAGWVIEGG